MNVAPLAESLRILLVEDNFLNQKFTKTALTKAGHNVDIAENSKVAVEKFTANSYDVILMDVQLPIMDGIEATRQIRMIEKQRGTHTPIIAVTPMLSIVIKLVAWKQEWICFTQTFQTTPTLRSY